MQLSSITAALSLFSLALAQGRTYHLTLDIDTSAQELDVEAHRCTNLDDPIFARNARIEPSTPQIYFFFYEPHCEGGLSNVAPRPEWNVGVSDFEVGSVLCRG
ncbi:uncharacterized protein ASPGLDRAFT_35566 [Aspergillus glaucus CBS 516.65]|uniref:AA1-like domain-containing protein n=1 Tax=Aspergillus glaucus CBS 516.65 TaxID=1160497 RepID=A0A1L9VK87_ASPGL|nr:hypothetical protein ASPGLDRAFT_35566 [Aspergillus glaucus CBS 516.65]OJJ84290.1 hypothetical protein ASPGLDRAFT_35566 [Aspergillus glaucus CBS 516.65]